MADRYNFWVHGSSLKAAFAGASTSAHLVPVIPNGVGGVVQLSPGAAGDVWCYFAMPSPTILDDTVVQVRTMAIHGHKTRESQINSMLLIMGDHGTVKVDKSVDPRALPSGSTLPAEGDFSLAFSFPPERVTGALCIAIKTKFDPNGRITFGSAFLAFEQL